MPTLDALNATAMRAITSKDYVATYEPRSRKVTKLEVLGFAEPRGLNLHGMDVVPDEHDPELLWVYLVNHRPPMDPTVDATEAGADSAIEIFTTRLGSNSIAWVKTIEDSEVVVTPNDIIGGSNGQEFWFTNDHHAKLGMVSMYSDYVLFSGWY
jgi:arylesterase/paraoxonase